MSDKNLNSFNQFLSSVDYGNVHDQLTEKLQAVVADLTQHKIDFGGKPKGSLTLKLDFVLDDKLMEVHPDIKTKTPEAKHGKSMYFVTQDNKLSREDPRQHKLPLDEMREKRNHSA